MKKIEKLKRVMLDISSSQYETKKIRKIGVLPVQPVPNSQGYTIVGLYQNGKMSYYDILREDGTIECDFLYSQQDPSKWFDYMMQSQ